MGAHRKHLLRDIFIGTTIERVIRVGTFPVLMVNHEAQKSYENVLAPVDMSEASASALRVALALGVTGRTGATVLHAFVALAKGKMFIAGSDQASMDEYVAQERATAAAELDAFLAAYNLDREKWSLLLEEGEPNDVISSTVDKTRPDLLVMGTRGRSGLVKALLGSVTETCLRSLSVDILAVPPIRR
jgi:nucleotide-binding universal stress UspA family protein